MANKVKMISINELERAVKEIDSPNTSDIEWNGIKITVKHRLNLKEMLSFVDSVTKSCFSDKDGSYLPEVLDFAIRCGVMDTYANFKLPANVERKYALVYGCEAIGPIMNQIDRTQFDAIVRAINEKIEYLSQMNISSVASEVGKLIATIQSLDGKLGAAFDDVSGEDIVKLAELVAGGNLDQNKLVEAYMKLSGDSSQNANE